LLQPTLALNIRQPFKLLPMSGLSQSEDDYIKAIFRIYEKTGTTVSTNSIANHVRTTAASVTDMIKRLAEKGLINYEKYKGVSLNSKGNIIATQLVRRNRLWKVFMVEKLNFKWDEIQEAADALEHIYSEKLINEMDQFLDFPKYDPHGDPIPDRNGKYILRSRFPLSDVQLNKPVSVIGILNNSPSFLQYLDSQNIAIGTQVILKQKFEFDKSFLLTINRSEKNISYEVAKNILVKYAHRLE